MKPPKKSKNYLDHNNDDYFLKQLSCANINNYLIHFSWVGETLKEM